MNWLDCFQDGQLRAVPAEVVQQASVARQEIEPARRADTVAPAGDDPVPSMGHVLLVSGHGSYDTRRTEVETLERRPEHSLDAGELEHDVRLRIEGGHLVPRHRTEHSGS
jgi:hypothetical protein